MFHFKRKRLNNHVEILPKIIFHSLKIITLKLLLRNIIVFKRNKQLSKNKSYLNSNNQFLEFINNVVIKIYKLFKAIIKYIFFHYKKQIKDYKILLKHQMLNNKFYK